MEQHLFTQTRQEQLEQPRMAAVGTVPWKCDMSIIHRGCVRSVRDPVVRRKFIPQCTATGGRRCGRV